MRLFFYFSTIFYSKRLEYFVSYCHKIFSILLSFISKELVGKLYDLFLGTLMVKSKDGKYVTTSASGVVQIKPENKRMPSNTRLRLKLMPYLLRSKEASLSFPTNVQAIFDVSKYIDCKASGENHNFVLCYFRFCSVLEETRMQNW